MDTQTRPKLTKDLKKTLFPENLILCGYRGSVAQNTYLPSDDPNSVDDVDLMGVYLAPPEFYLGLGRGKRYYKSVERFVDCWDVVSYEARKFVNLLINSNPNVLSLLFLRDNLYLPIEDAENRRLGRLLVENRDLFLSKNAYHSFTGYARSQLKRMTHHNYEGYMGEKRKALVDKYGYDTKNASHLIRLLKMGMEILTTGEVHVHRLDAPMLIDIKTGGWSLEKVQSEAERLFALTEEAFIRSKLADKPDRGKIEAVTMQLISDYLYRAYYGKKDQHREWIPDN